jgi:hypothetical protein
MWQTADAIKQPMLISQVRAVVLGTISKGDVSFLQEGVCC